MTEQTRTQDQPVAQFRALNHGDGGTGVGDHVFEKLALSPQPFLALPQATTTLAERERPGAAQED